MFIRPTEDSGFAWVLAEKIMLTVSFCASHLDGLGDKVSVMGGINKSCEALHVVTVPTTFAIVDTVK